VHAGTEPPNFIERLESSMTLSGERLRTRVSFHAACANERLINPNWPQAAGPYDTSLGLADAWRTWVTDRPVRGPDGVAVTIWIRCDDNDLPFHDPPYDRAGVTWQELAESQKTYTVCVRRTPAGPTQYFSSFATETSARWYAVELAQAVRQSGIVWLRPSDILPDRSRPPRFERILASEITGVNRDWSHRSLRLSQRARARWRQVTRRPPTNVPSQDDLPGQLPGRQDRLK
jgi:hypothetical protein